MRCRAGRLGHDSYVIRAARLISGATIADDQGAATRVAAGDFAWRDAPERRRYSIAELAVLLSADWPRLSLAH